MIENVVSQSVFLIMWFLIYIILGFESTVIAILLFILVALRNQK